MFYGKCFTGESGSRSFHFHSPRMLSPLSHAFCVCCLFMLMSDDTLNEINDINEND